MKPMSLAAILAFALVVSVARPVGAQEADPPPPLDVAAAVSYMREEWLDRDLKKGWVLSVQRHLNDTFAVVGEGGGNYTRVDPYPVFIPYSNWVHAILGGPRVSLRPTPQVALFGQVLAGWVRRTRTSPGSAVTPLNEGDVNTLGIQPGVGFEYRLNRKVAVRFQGDYRKLAKTSVIPRSTSETRFLAGFVFGVERRGSPTPPS